MSYFWTDERVAELRELVLAGKTGSQLGAHFHTSRNAAISAVKRRLPGYKLQGVGGRTRKDGTKPQALAPRLPPKPKPAAPKREATVRRAMHPKPAAKPVLVLVNGQSVPVRRFAPGETCDAYVLKRYLEERGYRFNGGWQGKCKITGRGKRMVTTWKGVVAFVDEIRVKEGLQPFIAGRSEPMRVSV